nr:putative reverse transcriptase domain-containing protein [Tanacetum cinerariifolium]
FWTTAKAKTINGEGQVQALVDGKKILITKSTVRRDLLLEDAKGVDCLPNTAIFEQLTLIGLSIPACSNIITISVKYPLIDWEIHSEGSRSYWKIIRVGGITKAYRSFEDMLKSFDREDLDALWGLVKEKFSSAVPNAKSYVDLKRKPMEFQVEDKVMLKTSPWKGVVRFGKRGKLNPRVHNTFHVSNLKKCHADEPLAVPLDELHVDDKLHFVEEPVEIIDREVKWLKRSSIPLVKVRWNSKRGLEFTWEREDQFKQKYPHLFTNRASSSTTSRAKSAKKHTKQNIWKPTGHVFTEVGFKWKPTGRTFTIVGNSCPLTRITSANVVPPKKTTSHSVETQKPELKASNVRDIPSSSSLVMIVRFGNDHIARIMRYGDYQLGNVTISRVYYIHDGQRKTFKLNMEIFRDIFKICHLVQGQDFDALPTDEEIVSFLREFGHTAKINSLNDIVVGHMYQPWRTFAALINKSLSGKTTALDKLRLSRAQILWGAYRSLVIQKRVKDLQLGVESYQKKINVTKPETTKSRIRKKDLYTPYQDPQGFMYVDDSRRNRLICSDELYKFSDDTLTRLRTLLGDLTKNI